LNDINELLGGRIFQIDYSKFKNEMLTVCTNNDLLGQECVCVYIYICW